MTAKHADFHKAMIVESYEADYLRLASRKGMEGLASECPCIGLQYWRCSECERKKDGTPIHNAHRICINCYQGSGRLPLPEAERLGALVRVALAILGSVWLFQGDNEVRAEVKNPAASWPAFCGEGPHTRSALTRALLAATNDA